MSRKVLWENSTLGPLSYSAALAICNLDSVFHTLGLARRVSGERPDALPSAAGEEHARLREGAGGLLKRRLTSPSGGRPGRGCLPDR